MPRIIKDVALSNKQAVQVGLQNTRGFSPTFLPSKPASSGEPTECECSKTEDVEQLAKEQAEAILAEAEASAAALKREATIQGYSDGHAEGLQSAQEQCKEYLERIAELARRAAIDRESMFRSAEKELATLAMEIATKVIKRELQSDPSIVLSMVENALSKVGDGDIVRIIVHPEDAELVRSKWSELQGAVAFGPNWEIVGDEQVERGGCKVESRGGFVDSRIETQLAEIADVFEVTL